MSGFHIDRFSTTDGIPARRLTYELIRETVLKAGRYSVFEATETAKRAKLFTMLGRDETLVCDNTRGYPWIYVRLASAEETEKVLRDRARVKAMEDDMVCVGGNTYMPSAMAAKLKAKVENGR